MKSIIKYFSFFAMVLSLVILTSCEDKGQGHSEDELEVTLAINPDPATVNTPITLTFEVEDHGEHVAVTMYGCEIEKEGTGNHMDMPLMPEMNETGHYSGQYTFAESGAYEVHFGFMHENEMHERQFEIIVQ